MLPEWNGTLFRIVLDSSLRISLVAAAVAIILITMRVRAGGVRHAAWTAVLCAMLLMPVLPYCIPSIALPIAVPSANVPAIPATPETPPLRRVAEGPEVTPPTAALMEQPAPVPEIPPARGPVWPIVALAVYAVGAVILLSRLFLGWRAMQQMTRASQELVMEPGRETIATQISGATPICESSLVSTPLTVGVILPKIILPAAWRLWPDEKLRAVLAHELAHVQRRDPLVALLAQLNRCLFWFHPLAWWLERKLATTAEHACDDAAVRTTGEVRRYAEVLLDMAEAVRRSGGRLSWQGVGANGIGLLGQRIDRILRGDLLREVSRTRRVVVAVGCAAAIFLIVACRQQPKPLTPLQEDPKFAAERAQQKARSDFIKAAREMNAQQVADLEATLKKNPEDLVALEKLLVFYAPISERVKGEKDKWAPMCAQVIGEKECIAARRPHILWLIEHHPDNELAGDWGARIYPTPLDPLPDPAGYAEAKKLWLAQAARPDAGVQVFSNAANFFEAADKPLAEKMLLRAQALDPKGRWSYSLGRLYAFVLAGSNSSTPLNVVRTVSMAEAHSPYAQEIRKKLTESTDVELLTVAGDYLLWDRGLYQDKKIDFDPVALGKSYLERAVQLNPQATQARNMLMSLQLAERNAAVSAPLRNVPWGSQFQVVSALPDAERFKLLPDLADHAYLWGENADYYEHKQLATDDDRVQADYYKRNQISPQDAWERARKYAEDELRLAAKFRNDPEYGTAIFRANVTLGTIALREGDRKAAVKYMLEASKAPPSDELAFSTGALTLRLLRSLLQSGERESVISFMEYLAKVDVREKDYWLESVEAVKNGRMPIWYQATMTKQ